MRGPRPVVAYVAGAGPEQAQYAKGMGRLLGSILGNVRVNQTRQAGGVRRSFANNASPQQFVSHPAIADETAGPASGFVLPHLPGRQPPAGWDGEPGASSPHRGTV